MAENATCAICGFNLLTATAVMFTAPNEHGLSDRITLCDTCTEEETHDTDLDH